MSPRHGLRVAEINLRAGRSGCAKRQPAKLQTGRCGLGALANQVEGKFAVFRLWIVVKDLKPIDDGAHRADEIVADPGTKQRRKLEASGTGPGDGAPDIERS